MQTTTPRKSLQTLTTTVTAFRSWLQFAESMEAGYCPTLRTFPGRSKSTQAQNDATLELRTRLVQMGYRVFPESL